MPTLPTDSNERKGYPLFRGLLRYFPAALAGVSRISKLGNDKHNPGEEMHHARGKSNDHADCIMRHLMDVSDLLSYFERAQVTRSEIDETGKFDAEVAAVLEEVSCLAWRSLALSQELHERFGSPLAPGAKVPEPAPVRGISHADAAADCIPGEKCKYGSAPQVDYNHFVRAGYPAERCAVCQTQPCSCLAPSV